MPTSAPSGRRVASARRPLLAVLTAAFILLQQVAFVFPAAAQTRRPALDRSDRTVATKLPGQKPAGQSSPATAALDDPGPPAIDRGTGSVSLTTLGSAYTQNFNTLSNTAGSTTNETLPTGWYITETGSGARDNDQYAVDTGGSNTGDTFSYGAAGNTDRALGGLQSGTLIPTIGAQFTNNTGGTITSLDIAYTGEQWRIANTAAARDDRLDFQISTDATNLCGADSGTCVGTYTDVNALDFTNPIKTAASAGALDGNNAANRTAVSTTVSGLSIANGATFWIRWNDLNASGADDGLAVDDFSITPQGAGTPAVNLSINDVSQNEGNAGTTAFLFTVSLSAPAGPGGVTFDIATADGTAQDDNPATEDNDYTANSLTGQTIPAGSSTYAFTVQVNGDTATEPNETFFVNVTNVTGATVADGQGQGTIVNDDITLSLIHDVQGNGAASPIPGANVTVRGVVTLLKSNGFFLQEETGDNDADPNTSEGVFVFTSAAPLVAVGDQATVPGTVSEFNGLTEITASNANITVNSTGNALPTAVTLTTADLPPTANFAQPQLEKYEGMRLAAASLTTVAPNDTFFDVPTVITGEPRPMREPGIPASDPVPPDPTSGTPDPNIPIWDENPERLMLDTNGRAGSTGEAITSNVVITNVAGPLDFSFGAYRLINEAALTRTANMTAVAVPEPLASEFTIASYNIENFNNNATQRQKAALTVRTLLHYPDIIGAVEIFDLADLQALRDQINNDAVAAGDPNPQYEAYLFEQDGTSEDSDQDVGFLVKTSRVSVTSVTQEREEETFTEPGGGTAILHDRPPLVLDGIVDPSGANPRRVLVVVNHLRSFIDSELVAGDGPRVREKRKKQAESLADLLNDLQAGNPGVPVVSVGDYNAFQFSSGYDDSVSVIKGNPTPDDQIVVDQSPDLVEPNFFNLIDELPAAERYSFVFENTPQALDHHIVNTAARARNTRTAIARVNSDFPEAPAATYASNASTPERNSDHDPVVSYYSLGNAQAAGSLIISEFRFHGANLGEDEASPKTGGGSDTPGGPNAPGTQAENDEFVEFYNNTDSDITVSTIDGSEGWALVASDGVVRFTIPNGTVIPARHHFLIANIDGYSLFDYSLPDGEYTLNILDESGIALFRTANPAFFTIDQRLDAVGYSSVPELYREGAGLAVGPEVGGEQEYSWLRQMCAFVQGVGCTTPGLPKDSGFNQNDFVSVDTSGVTQSLGAPGPEGLGSPVQRNANFPAVLLDTARSAGAAPNRVRDFGDTGQNKSFGTMSIRRTVTNNPGEPVNYLSFRVIQITTFPTASPADADLRVLDSGDITVTRSNGTQVDVRGTYVETPPDQSNGGALNSSLGVGYINLEGNPIAVGETVSVQFLLGVEKTGNFRFYINVEAFEDCECPEALGLKSGKAQKAQKAQPRASEQDTVSPSPRRGRGRRR
ncbi:MAG: endonuclease/exonuclease/phosphatase family protein [Pyrinomonadaceae bacterium]